MSDMKMKVLRLLKTYPEMQQKATQLRFELENLAVISEEEVIDSLTVGHVLNHDGRKPCSGISDKTMAAALKYKDVMAAMNNETASEVMRELRMVESELRRLEHYLSLLPERQGVIIKRYYIEGRKWEDIEKELHVSRRVLLYHRDAGLEILASMYDYLHAILVR